MPENQHATYRYRITIGGIPVDPTLFNNNAYTDIYNSIWQNMDRENNLINQRINWAILLGTGFITAQSFIASSIIKEFGQSNVYWLQGVACCLMAFMSLAATYVTWRASVGVEAAIAQLSYLKDYYDNTKANAYNLFEDILRLPRPFGDPSTHNIGNQVARAVAPALLYFWLILFSTQLIAGIIFLSLAFSSPGGGTFSTCCDTSLNAQKPPDGLNAPPKPNDTRGHSDAPLGSKPKE